MVKLTSLLTFFFFILLSGCQVKEATSNGGLISGHAPTTNKFTLTVPGNKVYVEGEVLRFKLNFPFDIESDTTGGDPHLNIKIGGTTRAVVLKQFSTPKELLFEYTITNLDSAPAGIEVQSFSLTGAVLQFQKNNTLVNCDVSSVQYTQLPQVIIDTAKPSVTSMILLPLPPAPPAPVVPIIYHTGDEILFALNFSEKVFVTGVPEFGLTLNTAVKAKYISGSGSTLLIFSYTVKGSDYDVNGFTNASNLTLLSATIKDSVGNDALTNIPAVAGSINHKIIGTLPYVKNVKLPTNKSYVAAQTLEFEFEFDRPMNVTSIPKYAFSVGTGGSNTLRYATYASGTGTNKLLFTYVAVPGDVDPDGIEVATTILQDGASDIRSVTGNISFFTIYSNLFTPPSATGILLNAVLPKAVSVARNADTTKKLSNGLFDDVWVIGQKLFITVNFNTEITVNTTMGTPAIEFFINNVKKEATYLSGGNGQTALVFTYEIVEGDADNANFLPIGNIVTHGGTITDSVNTIADLNLPAGSRLNTIKIDGIRPTISSMTPPSDKVYSTKVAGGISSIFQWSEEVHLGLAGVFGLNVDIGGSIVNFTTTNSAGTTSSTFATTSASLAGKNDADGVTLISPLVATGKVYDAAGNEALNLTFTPPATPNVKVDTKNPKILSITPQVPDGYYVENDPIIVTIVFDEIVQVVTSGEDNYLNLDVGGPKKLIPLATASGTTHDYNYIVGPSDNGEFKIQNTFTGTGIFDLGQNPIDSFSAPVTSGIIIDTKVPTILSATIAQPVLTLVAGNLLEVSVTFSEPVIVTGGPYITAVIGGTGGNNLNYTSGSGTNIIKFARTITTSHFNMKGLPANINTINLNGGTILDIAKHPVPLTFPSLLDLSGIKITYPQVKIWSQANFVNIAPSPVALTNAGNVTTAACGSLGQCRVFDDSDNVKFTGTLNTDFNILMMVKTPLTPGPHLLVANNLELTDAGGGQYNIGGGTVVSPLTPLDPDKLYLVHTKSLPIDINSSMNFFSAGFDGAVGEIVIIDNSITSPNLNNVIDYLNGKFAP